MSWFGWGSSAAASGDTKSPPATATTTTRAAVVVQRVEWQSGSDSKSSAKAAVDTSRACALHRLVQPVVAGSVLPCLAARDLCRLACVNRRYYTFVVATPNRTWKDLLFRSYPPAEVLATGFVAPRDVPNELRHRAWWSEFDHYAKPRAVSPAYAASRDANAQRPAAGVSGSAVSVSPAFASASASAASNTATKLSAASTAAATTASGDEKDWRLVFRRVAVAITAVRQGQTSAGEVLSSIGSSMRLKCVFAGDARAGKTSLVTRLARNTWGEFMETTIGSNWYTRRYKVSCPLRVPPTWIHPDARTNLEGEPPLVEPKMRDTTTERVLVQMDDAREVGLEMWDTAGQERYNSLAPMYWRGANCGVLVLDASTVFLPPSKPATAAAGGDKKSVEAQQQAGTGAPLARLQFWYDSMVEGTSRPARVPNPSPAPVQRASGRAGDSVNILHPNPSPGVPSPDVPFHPSAVPNMPPVLMLAITKIDLLPEADGPVPTLQNGDTTGAKPCLPPVYDRDPPGFLPIRRWAEERGVMLCYYTSAKTGQDIEAAFHALVEKTVYAMRVDRYRYPYGMQQITYKREENIRVCSVQ